jgi:basic membrane lipoprotein Med (substrate-binding protein (PBP1-ABC) superfamily)
MSGKKWVYALMAAVLLVPLLAACGTSKPEVVGGFEIPAIQKGKYNVAFVLIGPHNDGGWSQAHYEGLQYIQANMKDVHTAYVENVPEGTDSEQVFRSLSRKGFNVIFGTSFGYMDPMETVAPSLRSSAWAMPSPWACARPARSAPWTCAGSAPGTTQSPRRMPLPRCLTPAPTWY